MTQSTFNNQIETPIILKSLNSKTIQFGVLILILIVNTAQAQNTVWVKKPSKQLFTQTPGLVHEIFESTSMKTEVGYSIILPPSYQNGTRKYPVVYWLHGGGGNECSSIFMARYWRELYESNKVREIIIVCPNGFRSGYMDHIDGKTMVESMIIKELIPRIDKQYRTIQTSAGRAAHGFSMGASGSLKFAFKYPDMFCAAVAYGGGAVDLEKDKSGFIRNILQRNLNSDPDLIRQNNTFHFLKKNHQKVLNNDIRFLLICGDTDSWKKSAVTFQAALKEKNIHCDLSLVPEVGHNLRALADSEGHAAALFQEKVFQKRLDGEN